MTINKLVLIDGHALAYRMYFALPINAFSTKDGEPTNATYGFTRTLLEWMFSNRPPQYLAVCFDKSGSFRDEIYPEYKGTREKMPDDLNIQIQRLHEVVSALGIPILEMEGYEADDIIGTLAFQARAQSVPVHIITGDRDLLQLVDENTVVELPANRSASETNIYNDAAVEQKYGIRPNQIVDWKALEGDKSDNIPGVTGIGRKTAVRLLNTYDTLDSIYDNLDAIATRWRSKLEADRDQAYLSRTLATIVRDVPVELDLEACRTQSFDANIALEMFRELEFRSLTNILLENVAVDAEELAPEESLGSTDVVIVRSVAQLEELARKLEQATAIAFDVETDALDKFEAELVGISLSIEPPTGYYIPVGHRAQVTQGQMDLFKGQPRLADDQLPVELVLDKLRPAMTDPNIGKIAHNAKFDYIILRRAGLDVSPLTFDTMIAEWLCDPSSKHLGLKDLTRHRLGIEMQQISELIGKGRSQKTFAEVGIDEGASYAAADADMTMRLVEPLQRELQEKSLADLMGLEMALVPVLAAMESEGVAIDEPFFSEFSQQLAGQIHEISEEIFVVAGKRFNINSTQQLSEVMFDELELPPYRGMKKMKSGYFSTASHVLENLMPYDEYGITKLILAYRELDKLKGTYVDSLPQLVNSSTGRIHTSFRQTGVVSGRLSSNSPNLQNIPVRTALTRRVRKGFVPRSGWQFVAADYSQVELRILAHVSGDEQLISAFRNDQDVHRATAASVYDIELEDVTFEQRQFAKKVNFGLMYGMGAHRLARDSDLTFGEAKSFIDTYFKRFPAVRAYLDGMIKTAHEQGYVETLMGRRRYFPVLLAQGRQSQQAVARAEREAINHPIQGTAADIIKLAMCELHEKLLEQFEARMILQVHDELILESPPAEIAEVKQVLHDTMCNAFELIVPLKVEVSVGDNWLELKQ